jgi:hypothetical protein
VFNRRGHFECLSFLPEAFGKYQTPAARLSEFPPVALGAAPEMARLLAAGVFDTRKGPWLQSWLRRDCLESLPQTAFFADESAEPRLRSGSIVPLAKSSLEWLPASLAELAEIDPRVPTRARGLTAQVRRSVDAGMELAIEELSSKMGDRPRAIFVAGSEQAEVRLTQRMLIESFAERVSGEIVVLCLDTAEDTVRNASNTKIRYLGVGKPLSDLEFPVLARLLLCVILSKRPERVHLFLESAVLADFCAELGKGQVPEGIFSASVMPKLAWKSVAETALMEPELYQKASAVTFGFFSDEQELRHCMQAYGEARVETLSPWAPSEWRSRLLHGDAVPTSSDAKIARRLVPRFEAGREVDWLGIRNELEGWGRTTGVVSPACPAGFLSLHQTPGDLPGSPYFLARDGALALSLFFGRCGHPGGYRGKILVPESLGGLIPPAWKSRALVFRMRAMGNRSPHPDRLVLFGVAYPRALPLQNLEAGLETIKRRLGQRLQSMRIDCYFPHQHSGWGAPEGSTYPAEFVRTIRRCLRGYSFAWLDDEAFFTFEPGDTALFHDLQQPVFCAVGGLAWSLLSRGAHPLETAEDHAARPGAPSVTIAASARHLIEAYSPGSFALAPVSLRELCGEFFDTPAYAHLLGKVMPC